MANHAPVILALVGRTDFFYLRVGSSASERELVLSSGDFFRYTKVGSIWKSRDASRPTLTPITGEWQLTENDGTQYRFTTADGTTRHLLIQVIDPQGLALTLTYDAALRLTKITDATGLENLLGYAPSGGDGVPTDVMKIRQITDPFGRIARFRYDMQGRLITIEDSVGIVSSFRYGRLESAGDPDFITHLITTYGSHQFSRIGTPAPQGGYGFESSIIMVDPQGDTEASLFLYHSDYYPSTSGIDTSDFSAAIAIPPSSLTVAGPTIPFFQKTIGDHFHVSAYLDKKTIRRLRPHSPPEPDLFCYRRFPLRFR